MPYADAHITSFICHSLNAAGMTDSGEEHKKSSKNYDYLSYYGIVLLVELVIRNQVLRKLFELRLGHIYDMFINPMALPDTIQKIKPSIALIVALDAQKQLLGTGSGFVFGEKNILVTCSHVVKDSISIVLKFPDGGAIDAKVVLRDEEHDLALLKFNDDNRGPIPLGDLDRIVEGMSVVFSGYPFSSENLTTHQGIISAITKDATGITSYLIDGTVNSGNSGCPLLDADGKVIGVVNAKRRNRNDLLERVEGLKTGALSLHGVDIVEIYQALAGNIQLGVGYAVPAKYIPEHKKDAV